MGHSSPRIVNVLHSVNGKDSQHFPQKRPVPRGRPLEQRCEASLDMSPLPWGRGLLRPHGDLGWLPRLCVFLCLQGPALAL